MYKFFCCSQEALFRAHSESYVLLSLPQTTAEFWWSLGKQGRLLQLQYALPPISSQTAPKPHVNSLQVPRINIPGNREIKGASLVGLSVLYCSLFHLWIFIFIQFLTQHKFLAKTKCALRAKKTIKFEDQQEVFAVIYYKTVNCT